MPAGTFQSELTPDSRAGGSLTGSGAPSQPRGSYLAPQSDIDQRTRAGWNQVATAGGSGYTAGANQFPMGQGPSAYAPGSIAQYPNAIYGNPSIIGANQLAQTMFGPQQILLQQTLARQQSQLMDPLYGPLGQAGHATDALYRDTALARQGLGLDKQSLELERGLAAGQLGNLGKLRAILEKQRGLALGTKQLGHAEAKDLAERKQWDLRSDLTARGAHTTVANERGTGRINRDLVYQMAGLDQQFRNTMLGLDEKSIGYDNQQLALNNKLANIGLDAQRLGLSEQQLQNSLADGLYQIGLGAYTSINSLLDAIGGTNVQQAQMAATIMQYIAQMAGLPPGALSGLMGQLGLPTGSGATSNQGPGYEQ